MLAGKKDKEAKLKELKNQMQAQKEGELSELKQRLEGENTQLRGVLSDKSSELELAQVEIERLETELSKREQGLGSAASSLDMLKKELRTVRGEFLVASKDRDENMKKKDKLLVRPHRIIVCMSHV